MNPNNDLVSHTPGPHRTDEENTGGGFNIYAGNVCIGHTAEVSRVIATRMAGPLVSAAEAKANAVLFAAAEAMLEALKGVLPYMEAAESRGLIGDEGCHWPVEAVRCAIAKAAGPNGPTSSTDGGNR